jgi:HEAT repeat protein
LEQFVAQLGDRHGTVRQRARCRLERIGRPAVPALVSRLADKRRRVRWESAKALGRIADPHAAPALVAALTDEKTEVRWLAAEALIALERKALRPLYGALRKDPDSVWLRHGAHHVMHALERVGLLSPAGRRLLDSLRSLEPEVSVVWAADVALKVIDGEEAGNGEG